MSESAVKIIPPMSRVKDVAIDGLKGGLIGGLAVGIAAKLFGPTLGAIGGGILSGAMLGGDVGRIVAINAIMDGVLSLFAGNGAGGTSTSAEVM